MEIIESIDNSGRTESTDIHDYLNSFNKEIQEGVDTGNPVSEKSPNQTGVDKKNCSREEKSLTGITFFSAPDGTLYSTTGSQSDSKHHLTFLSSTDNPTGLQHILLAVSDVNNLSNVPSADFSIPVQLSSQIYSGGNAKQSASLSNSVKNVKIARKADYSIAIKGKPESLKDDGCKQVLNVGPKAPSKVDQMPAAVVQFEEQAKSSQLVPEDNEDSLIIAGSIPGEEIERLPDSVAQQPADDLAVVNPQDSYQAVTLMPSDAAPNELSYVLFLTPQKDNNESKGDASSEPINYENDDKVLKSVEEGNGFKTLTLRLAHRPTQILAQHHSCNYCDYSSAKRYLLSRHLKSHSDDRPHKCSVCARGFKTMASLHNHVNTHTGTRPHSCKECDSCFTTSGELVRHVRYKHTHEKPHHCNECDYASVELSKLKRHMRCHTGERPYQCPHCTYASPDTYKLKRHMRIHTGEKPYACKVCPSRFTQSNSLKAHQLIHSGSKPAFQCDFCPTTCGRKTDLRIHMRKLHSFEMSYFCKDCNITFQDQDAFNQHCKSHEEEDDEDESVWFNLQNLDATPKSFPCDVCDETFDEQGNLRQHKSICHNIGYKSTVEEDSSNNNNTCVKCYKSFSTKRNLLRHFATHDSDFDKDDDVMEVDESVDDKEVIDISDNPDTDSGNKQVVVLKLIHMDDTNSRKGQQMLTTADGQTIMMDGTQAFTVVQPVPADMEGLSADELSHAVRSSVRDHNAEDYLITDGEDHKKRGKKKRGSARSKKSAAVKKSISKLVPIAPKHPSMKNTSSRKVEYLTKAVKETRKKSSKSKQKAN